MKTLHIILAIIAILVLGYFTFPFIVALIRIIIGSIFVLTFIAGLIIGILIGRFTKKKVEKE
jgi:uncharacterized membrane-anchored protein YhcB (DUF1043 family)